MRRPDGTPIKNLSLLRRFMPFAMPTRNEAVVYFEQRLDVARCLAWIESQGGQYSFYEVILAALLRTFVERPHMNRFVAGGRLWQRKGFEFSFAVKKRYEDAAPFTTVKVSLPAEARLSEVKRAVEDAIGLGRGDAKVRSEKEMSLVTFTPGFLVRILLGAYRWLDRHHLLPGSVIASDPLYATAMVVNLGSIGLDTAYHHLFEQGTIPVVAVVGRIKKAPVVTESGELAVGEVVDVRYSYDERIADGFYAARSLEVFKAYVEDPARLL